MGKQPPGHDVAIDRKRRIQHRSLATQTADSLRDMILKGVLRPGQQLRHGELARDLGVSTMPVREALLRLSHEGFVIAKPNRSFIVNAVTRKDIHDVYWMHGILAGELAARACENAGSRLHAQLDALLAAWEVPSQANRLDQLNWEFHRAINIQANSPRLLSLLRGTLVSIPHEFYALIPEWRTLSDRGHKEIVDAFGRRDPQGAREAGEAHVREAGELLIRYFSEHGYWISPDGSS